ncbi:MAG TPA: protoporphyrinogen oxidase [Nitrospirales bacterium]|nr:protoporphyrinogen oxidase [Nitrospiraceae bacterium]HNP31046.1 protoporphyrinogen oxidase [Nitrospirales bacterium]
MMRETPYQVVIIGGGISGLATAYALMEEGEKTQTAVQCTLVEREPRWGGKILTHVTDDYLIEGGPDSFLTSKPWALELCRTLGLQDQLISTNLQHNQTFSFCRGALRELPQGLLAFRPRRVDTLVSSGLLSWGGMLRMAAERFWPRRNPWPTDETLGEFFRRRFGAEAFENLIEPLVAGIYAGDAEELSIESTFPRFRALEREHGSIIKGMRKALAHGPAAPRSSDEATTMFMSLRGGLSELIRTLVEVLRKRGVGFMAGVECLEIQTPTPQSTLFHVMLDNGDRLPADAVVLATPAFQTARLLRTFQPETAGLLDGIPYASTATISMAYPTESIGPQIRGFGFVVPRKEQRPLLAATWTSLKWPDRSRAEDTLIRCYIGGRGRESVFEQDDCSLVECVRRELTSMVGITASPTYTEVHRWSQGMPQYVLGHRDRLAKVQEQLANSPGLYVTGAGLYGIGIPDCIREGTRVGRQLLEDHSHRKATRGAGNTVSR